MPRKENPSGIPNKLALRLLILAFAEGATVMACELLGAKMTAPFFGTSLYSWAAVLAVTLGGLAAGYYIGGILTTKKPVLRLLQVILLISGAFLFVMPWIANGIMGLLTPLPLTTGLLLSMIVFLLPPILLFGMVSPAIIHALVHDLKDTGKTAGKVYGISTIGGVINTLAMGFWVIPEFGLKAPAMIYGLVMIALPLLLLPLRKPTMPVVSAILFLIVGYTLQMDRSSKNDRELFHVQYASEGLLGQVKVVDYYNKMEPFGVLPLRGLLVNNTWQTVVNRDDGVGMLDYTYFMNPLFSYCNPGDKALLIGLGGGTLPSMMEARGLDLTVVELDPRLPKLARKYFGMTREAKVIVDDGRHFLRKDDNRYNMIVFDAFQGENPPWHLLTIETFEDVREKLLPDGVFLIEFYGFLDGKEGISSRSVFKTLQEAGFNVQVIRTGDEPGLFSNFIYICSESGIDFTQLDYSQKAYTDKSINDFNDYAMNPSDFERESSELLSDNLPALDRMLLGPAIEWRRSMNEHFRDLLKKDEKPVFY